MKLKLKVQSVEVDGTITLVPVVKHDQVHRCVTTGRKLSAKQVAKRTPAEYSTEDVLTENIECFTHWPSAHLKMRSDKPAVTKKFNVNDVFTITIQKVK